MKLWQQPAQQLPIRVRPVFGETVLSYVFRLAHANDLDRPTLLLRALGRPQGPVTRFLLDNDYEVSLNELALRRLETFTGRPAERLRTALSNLGRVATAPEDRTIWLYKPPRSAQPLRSLRCAASGQAADPRSHPAVPPALPTPSPLAEPHHRGNPPSGRPDRHPGDPHRSSPLRPPPRGQPRPPLDLPPTALRDLDHQELGHAQQTQRPPAARALASTSRCPRHRPRALQPHPATRLPRSRRPGRSSQQPRMAQDSCGSCGEPPITSRDDRPTHQDPCLRRHVTASRFARMVEQALPPARSGWVSGAYPGVTRGVTRGVTPREIAVDAGDRRACLPPRDGTASAPPYSPLASRTVNRASI